MITAKHIAVLFGLLAAGAGTAPSSLAGCVSSRDEASARFPGAVAERLGLVAIAERRELVPFGDFSEWAVRSIKESGIIGGETRTIYNLGPAETIDRNEPYDYSNTIWSSSNAYAVVMGVTKTSCSVTPAQGPGGSCARLQNCFAECRVAGLVNIRVMVAGSLYWGRMHEPITSINDPYSSMEWGIPFTKRPSAVVVDYCATIPDTGALTRGTTFRTETYPGHDPAEILLLLQNRWEDEQGNIHAKRVGTAFLRIRKSTDGWVMGRRIPVIYGDARESAAYRPYMDLLGSTRPLTAINSRGRSRVIQEEWGEPDTPVTHAIMIISSGSSGAYRGELGNELLVDNLMLEYDE